MTQKHPIEIWYGLRIKRDECENIIKYIKNNDINFKVCEFGVCIHCVCWDNGELLSDNGSSLELSSSIVLKTVGIDNIEQLKKMCIELNILYNPEIIKIKYKNGEFIPC